MKNVLGLKCLICGEKYAPSEVEYVCPKHGNDGILDVVYDYSAIASQVASEGIPPLGSGAGIWRYRALLPVRPTSPVPPLSVGDTPLYPAPRLAAAHWASKKCGSRTMDASRQQVSRIGRRLWRWSRPRKKELPSSPQPAPATRPLRWPASAPASSNPTSSLFRLPPRRPK